MSDPELIVLQVSSSCDDLLDQLNAISFLGDEHHRDRCTHLRHSLTHLNRAQGLGFEVFGTVIDRRMLVKVAFAMAGSAGTVVTALVTVGTRGAANAGSAAKG